MHSTAQNSPCYWHFFFVVSCSRNTEVSPDTIAGKYKVSAITADPDFAMGPPFGTITDVVAFYQQLTGTTCLRDITLSLYIDGTI